MSAPFPTVLAVLLVFAARPADGQDIDIRLHSGNDREQRAEVQLQRLLREYDLTPWLFTGRVVIESGVIPHSHPVLTLNTKVIDDDTRQLSTFLHEQIHWFLDSDSVALDSVIRDLGQVYPKVPTGRPEGSGSEFGTYLHLVVCWLEFDAMTHLVGPERARRVMQGKNYYTWIYGRVLEDTDEIGALVRRHDLAIDPQAHR